MLYERAVLGEFLRFRLMSGCCECPSSIEIIILGSHFHAFRDAFVSTVVIS
jgi:hypothetical protein